MRRFSTHIGVYAIWLIAAFYGSAATLCEQGKNVTNATAAIQKTAMCNTQNEQIVSKNSSQRKDEGEVAYVVLHQKAASICNAGAEQTFFTHSATIQHYINTL